MQREPNTWPIRPPIWQLALVLVATGAFPACERRSASDPGGGGSCSNRLPDESPPLVDVAPAELPKSNISVGVEVAVARLKRELGRQVPTQLARESGRNIGSPGEVTYVVNRGAFDVKLDRDRLVIATPVSAEVEVCKPLGPFCPTYGRCSPRLLSTASVPLVLDESYALGKSRVSVALTRPCVIAGLDVSPEIRKMGNQQAAGVQKRIDGSVPPLRPAIEAGWKQLFVPIALGASTCLRVQPDKLAQARPSLENGVLRARVAVTGELKVEQGCDLKAAGTATPLPPLSVEDELPQHVALDVPIRISWTEVSAALSRSLKTNAAPLRVAQIAARGAKLDEKPVLVLDATLDGTICGQVRLVADPVWDPARARLTLTRVRLAEGQPKRATMLQDSGVEKLIQEHAAVALPIDVTGTPTALVGLVERLTKEKPDGVEVDVVVKPAKIDQVLVDPSGLIPIAAFRGHATIRVR